MLTIPTSSAEDKDQGSYICSPFCIHGMDGSNFTIAQFSLSVCNFLYRILAPFLCIQTFF